MLLERFNRRLQVVCLVSVALVGACGKKAGPPPELGARERGWGAWIQAEIAARRYVRPDATVVASLDLAGLAAQGSQTAAVLDFVLHAQEPAVRGVLRESGISLGREVLGALLVLGPPREPEPAALLAFPGAFDAARLASALKRAGARGVDGCVDCFRITKRSLRAGAHERPTAKLPEELEVRFGDGIVFLGESDAVTQAATLLEQATGTTAVPPFVGAAGLGATPDATAAGVGATPDASAADAGEPRPDQILVWGMLTEAGAAWLPLGGRQAWFLAWPGQAGLSLLLAVDFDSADHAQSAQVQVSSLLLLAQLLSLDPVLRERLTSLRQEARFSTKGSLLVVEGTF